MNEHSTAPTLSCTTVNGLERPFSVAEAAEFFGVHDQTIRRWL